VVRLETLRHRDIPALIAGVFDPVLAADPHREALVTRRGRWSYAELDDAAATAAGALAQLGIKAGDRVAAVLPNEADIIFAFHGAMRIGAIWVGINQALAVPEKVFLLADSDSSVLLCDAGTAAALAPHRSSLPALRAIVDEATWHIAIDAAGPLRDLPPVDPFAPAGLAYTSGTTGRPKGVIHSQHNLITPGAVLVRHRGYDAELRKGDCLPLTILNMMVLTTLLVAQAGGTTVIMDQLYAEGVAGWIERERVTLWNGPPPILHSLVHSDTVTPEALASLGEVWSGGADLPEALRARFVEKFAVPLVSTYGLSESPTIVSIDPPDGEHVTGASGRVLPHLDVVIVGEDGRRLPTGQSGEICVATAGTGPFAGLYRPPLGYWKQPEASAAALAGGLLRTGDIGLVDDAGWLHVRDRKQLVILRGGANVYPAEVERVLNAIDGVAGSAVAGVADERLGERVVAAIELDPGATIGAAEIIERCAAELAGYKVPERIVFVDALPRNAMGKVDRVLVGKLVGEFISKLVGESIGKLVGE
jgi:long-chain acyl-CoA synthetase